MSKLDKILMTLAFLGLLAFCGFCVKSCADERRIKIERGLVEIRQGLWLPANQIPCTKPE